MLHQTGSVLGNYYFFEKRGIVNGIVTSGSGLGLVLFPVIIAYLLEIMGLFGAFFALAGIALQGILCGALIINPHKALQLKVHHHLKNRVTHGALKEAIQTKFDTGFRFLTSVHQVHRARNEKNKDHNPAIDILLPLNLLRPMLAIETSKTLSVYRQTINVLRKSVDVKLFCNFRYVIYLISDLLWMFSIVTPMVFLPDRAILLGIAQDKSSFLLSAVGVSNIVGRLAYGLIADIDVVRPYNIYLFVSAFVVSGLVSVVNFGSHYYQQMMYAAIFGFFMGKTFFELNIQLKGNNLAH